MSLRYTLLSQATTISTVALMHHATQHLRCNLTFAMQGNRRYVKCLYVYNKIDVCSMEEVDEIAR